MVAQNAPLAYKGHPLRWKDSLIYYGSMTQKYIIMLQVLSQKKDQGLDVTAKVSVQLQLTDPGLKSRDRVVRKVEEGSLYATMDMAPIWLECALANPQPCLTSEKPEPRPPGGYYFETGGIDPWYSLSSSRAPHL